MFENTRGIVSSRRCFSSEVFSLTSIRGRLDGQQQLGRVFSNLPELPRTAEEHLQEFLILPLAKLSLALPNELASLAVLAKAALPRLLKGRKMFGLDRSSVPRFPSS